MKTFKNFLNENLVVKYYILDYYYPLSEPMLKRIFNKLPRITAFHVTDFDGFNNLVKIEGSKKSISAFTNMGILALSKGIETTGGIVCKVEGNMLAKGDYDIYSATDSQGRRWIDVSSSDYEIVNPEEEKLKNIIRKVKSEIYKKFTGNEIDSNYDFLDYFTLYKNLSNKDKRLFVKYYFDGIEEKSRKNLKLIKDFIYGKVRGYLEITDYDELVLNNIKIKHIYIDGKKILKPYVKEIFDNYGKKYPIDIITDYRLLLKNIQNTKNI